MKKKTSLLLLFNFLLLGLTAQESLEKDLINRGIKLHDKGEYAGAINLYKKALEVNKRSAQANYEMASSYLSLKKYDSSVFYSDRVISINTDYIDQAYVLKGSALDLLGKPIEAINTYKKGLEKTKANHLLYYNLALTSFNLKQYKDTDDALQQALKLNPSHASSHFLLALSMLVQEQRVKGILALYNFLLLEPKTERTKAALQTLEEELARGVKKEDQKQVTITMPAKPEDDEFYTAELMLGLLESSKLNETNKDKTPSELFVENTNSFFTILGELKKDKKGFWWNFYVDYFYTLAINKHTEAFCYYITQSKGNAYAEWVRDNMAGFDAFSDWYLKYMHKF